MSLAVITARHVGLAVAIAASALIDRLAPLGMTSWILSEARCGKAPDPRSLRKPGARTRGKYGWIAIQFDERHYTLP